MLFWEAELEGCEYSSIFNSIYNGGRSVGNRGLQSSDEWTCVIYSQGPGRLTKAIGNKASSYFLTAVQTCIDRSLALHTKMRG